MKSYAAGDQKDSLSAIAKKRANKAALMSAVVPGMGQVYNKKYWKLPILYGAGGVLYYFIKTNNTEYYKYKNALIDKNDNDSLTTDEYPMYSSDELKLRKDYYRRNRDLSIILAGVLYTLNIIDAYVDSQLMDFDVSDNLSIRTSPAINYSAQGIPVPSVNFVLTFK